VVLRRRQRPASYLRHVPLTVDAPGGAASPRCAGIAHRTAPHPPVFTVAEAATLRGDLPGGHCKALFLREKNAAFGSRSCSRSAASASTSSLLGSLCRGFRSAAPWNSWGCLGCGRGGVTPFALVNDVEHRVTLVLEAAMLDHNLLNYHALANDRTTSISSNGLLRFIAACGRAADRRCDGP
jgi:Ala-tRNA(Pro) deacylase